MSVRSFAAVVVALVTGVVIVDCGGEPAASHVESDAGTGADAPVNRADTSDPDVPPEATQGSGTRFRTMHVEETWDDGTELRSFTGFFHDEELGDACSVQSVGGDAYACLPFGISRGEEGFGDAACTQPVLFFSNTLPEDIDAFVTWGPSCAPKFGRKPAAGTIQKSAVYQRDAVTQKCEARIGPAFIAVPEEIPATTFGTFTRRADTVALPDEKSGTRLVLESDRFESPDGAFERRAPRIVDTQRKSTGEVDVTADGSFRFFTHDADIVDSTSTFADAACANGVTFFAQGPTVCRPDPSAARDGRKRRFDSDRGCFAAHAYARPATPPLEVTYSVRDATCVSTNRGSSAGSRNAYASAGLLEVALSDLATVTRTVESTTRNAISGTRLEARAQVIRSSDGLVLRAREPSLYLRDLDLPCGRVADDRCQPAALQQVATAFADAECVDALALLLPTCDDPRPKYWQSGTDFLYAIPPGGHLQPTTVYRKTSETPDGCIAEPAAAGVYVRIATSTPVALTDLPKARVKAVLDR